MAYSLLGKNFIPPDIEAKVTGRAKYAEDFRVEGMVFCRLMLSPVPHGLVTNIDASEALAMEGVLGVLTADEVPTHAPNPILTNEPKYIGEPILAVAAVDETTAMDALDRIQVDIEPLDFVVDPLVSLYPGGPDARTEGNIGVRGTPTEVLKWTAQDFAAVPEGVLPMDGQPLEEWSFGDLEDAFDNATLVLDETFVTESTIYSRYWKLLGR